MKFKLKTFLLIEQKYVWLQNRLPSFLGNLHNIRLTNWTIDIVFSPLMHTFEMENVFFEAIKLHNFFIFLFFCNLGECELLLVNRTITLFIFENFIICLKLLQTNCTLQGLFLMGGIWFSFIYFLWCLEHFYFKELLIGIEYALHPQLILILLLPGYLNDSSPVGINMPLG